MSNCIVYYQLLYFRHTNPRDRRSESVSKKVEFWPLLRRSPGNKQRLPAELFKSKTSPAFKRYKKLLNLSLLLEIYLGICSIAHDCTSIEEKRVVFQHDFVGKNIIDLNNIYIDEIDRSLLTTELSFIGYKGFGNFLRIFQIVIFFHFLSKK